MKHKANILSGTLGVSFLALISACSFNVSKENTEHPNFIIIFTDDQGYGDLGCYGSPNIQTPNIDQIAAEGMRFTSFYAAPFCAPSRAQLMTGCYPARVGHARNPGPSSSYGLNPNEITIAELLKDEGYSTMCIGKWHLGDAPEFLPTSQGFDRYFGIPFSNDMWRYHPKMPLRENEDKLMKAIRERAAYTGFAGQGSYYPENGGFPNDLPLMLNKEVIELNPDQRLLTNRYADTAINFIKNNADQPFFLYLAFNMPHVPLFASNVFEGSSERGLYGDVVSEIDANVGRIMDLLKEQGLAENTLVIFTSDNGPWLQYGIDGGSAGPLRDGKGTVYEGGERVPAIFWWPGHITPGIRSSIITGNLDIMPTLAGLAGTEPPADRVIDGKNIWPVLSGKSENSSHEYFHYMAGSREGEVNYRAIRDEKWKLHFSIDKQGNIIPNELYDLGEDVGEKFNRLDVKPEIVERLKSSAEKFYAEICENQRPAGHVR
jgi:arylsulfatase A